MKKQHTIGAVIIALAAGGAFQGCGQGVRAGGPAERVYPPMKADSTLTFKSSYNGTVLVIEDGGVRSLRFKSKDSQSTQSAIDLRRPATLQFRYTICALLGFVYREAGGSPIKRVLMIGLGGGSLLRFMQQYYPQVAVDTVELDPVVADVARNYFFVREGPLTPIHVADGRSFVETTTARYDLVIVDAFNADSDIPRQLTSIEFLRILKKRLAPGGVVVTNFINNEDAVYHSITATYRAAFAHVRRFNLLKYDKYNIVMISFNDGKLDLPRWDLILRARTYARKLKEPYDLGDFASLADDSPPPGEPGVIHD